MLYVAPKKKSTDLLALVASKSCFFKLVDMYALSQYSYSKGEKGGRERKLLKLELKKKNTFVARNMKLDL